MPQHFTEILAIHFHEDVGLRSVRQLSRNGKRLGFTLGFAQAPLDETKRHGKAPAGAYHIIRSAGGHKAGEFRLVLRVSDHHHRGIRSK
jgi:hypothetical protein